MLRPPIARMGGKSRLRNQIIEKIPEHKCYVEPFFGAGWVFFGKKASTVEVINDIDGELVNLFKVIKYHAEEIDRLMQYEICSRKSFCGYLAANKDDLTDIQRAIRFMYIISQSFGSKGKHFGYSTTTRPSPQIFNTSNLIKLKNRLRNTYIENLGYDDIVKRYDRRHTFFFCDPPYYETSGYDNEFTKEDHIELNKILKSIDGKFLLTINDHREVRDWYKDFNIEEVRVGYSIGKEKSSRRKYKELIITNY